MIVSRRRLLRAAVTSAAILPIGYVVGCAEVAKVTSDADTIAGGIAAVLPAIQAISGISTSVVAKVQSGISAVKAAAAVLASATGAGAATAAQAVAAGVSAITTALQGFTLPSWVSTVLSSAQTLVPLVLQVAGVIMAGEMPDPKAITQARAVLMAAAAA